MPIAEVYYDHRKNIPIWTKHTLYGVSLAAPTRTFKSLEEIMYHNEWGISHAVYMKTALEYNYSNFNVGVDSFFKYLQFFDTLI